MNDTAAARVAPELSEKQIGVHHDLAYIRPPRTAVLSSVHLRTVELLQQTQLEKPFKMFARLYILSTFALLAVATPWGEPPPVTVTVTSTAPASTVTTVSQCNTGSISCCNTVAQAGSAEANFLAGLLDIVLGPVTGLLGFGCSPISVVGLGSGNGCSAHPVCCENNSIGGLINIGCIPITL